MKASKKLVCFKETVKEEYLECVGDIENMALAGQDEFSYTLGRKEALEWVLTWLEAILRTEGVK